MRPRIAVSEPGHETPAPSAAQKVPKEESITPTAYLRRFSGTCVERPVHEHAQQRDQDHRAGRAYSREGYVLRSGPEGHHDKHHLEPFEQHPLERQGEGVPVQPGPHLARLRLRRLQFLLIRCRLVVQCLIAAGPQNCLPQPLQAKHEEQRTHHQAEAIDRDDGERRPQYATDHGEHHQRAAHTNQSRPPPAGHARRQHDGERFYPLHAGGQKTRQNQKTGRSFDSHSAGSAGTVIDRIPLHSSTCRNA